MSLFGHRHRAVDGVNVYWRGEKNPAMSVGGTAAKAQLCSCGAILNRELTPNGWQQVGWGEDPANIYAALDREIIKRLEKKAWLNSS